MFPTETNSEEGERLVFLRKTKSGNDRGQTRRKKSKYCIAEE